MGERKKFISIHIHKYYYDNDALFVSVNNTGIVFIFTVKYLKAPEYLSFQNLDGSKKKNKQLVATLFEYSRTRNDVLEWIAKHIDNIIIFVSLNILINESSAQKLYAFAAWSNNNIMHDVVLFDFS